MKRFVAVILAISLLFLFSGCSTSTFKSNDGDWSIKLPKDYTKNKQVDDDKLKVKTTIFMDKAGTEIDITEAMDPKLVLNDNTLTTELGSDGMFKVTGTYKVESKAGTVYVAKAVDGVTNFNLMYAIGKINDKAVSFMIYQNPAFTAEQEKQMKDMLATLKKLK